MKLMSYPRELGKDYALKKYDLLCCVAYGFPIKISSIAMKDADSINSLPVTVCKVSNPGYPCGYTSGISSAYMMSESIYLNYEV